MLGSAGEGSAGECLESLGECREGDGECRGVPGSDGEGSGCLDPLTKGLSTSARTNLGACGGLEELSRVRRAQLSVASDISHMIAPKPHHQKKGKMRISKKKDCFPRLSRSQMRQSPYYHPKHALLVLPIANDASSPPPASSMPRVDQLAFENTNAPRYTTCGTDRKHSRLHHLRCPSTAGFMEDLLAQRLRV